MSLFHTARHEPWLSQPALRRSTTRRFNEVTEVLKVRIETGV